MNSASGLLYRNGDFVQGHVVMENGKVTAADGPLENADITGIILPRPVNCHTHLGDAFIRRPENITLEELVAPPDGLKHRMLASVDHEIQLNAMEGAMRDMAELGTYGFMDFREGGVQGARLLSLAATESGLRSVIFGRPVSGYDPDEMDELLGIVQGIGMSAVSDMDFDDLTAISGHARDAGRAFAIHASEARQEDSGRYLELNPDFLVHMVKADNNDLAACSDAGIPIVVCPGANALFGLKPPVRQMLDAGVTVCLGTDNAMLAKPDIFAEMRLLGRGFDLSGREILTMALDNGRKVLNSLPGLQAADRDYPDYLVLEAPLDDPLGAVLEASPGRIHLFDIRE